MFGFRRDIQIYTINLSTAALLYLEQFVTLSPRINCSPCLWTFRCVSPVFCHSFKVWVSVRFFIYFWLHGKFFNKVFTSNVACCVRAPHTPNNQLSSGNYNGFDSLWAEKMGRTVVFGSLSCYLLWCAALLMVQPNLPLAMTTFEYAERQGHAKHGWKSLDWCSPAPVIFTTFSPTTRAFFARFNHCSLPRETHSKAFSKCLATIWR